MKSDKYMYRILAGSTLFIVTSGTVFYHFVEKFPWVDAYYFSVITLATVGYGDLTPTTTVGKIFTTFYILIGVGIITTFVSQVVKHRVGKGLFSHIFK